METRGRKRESETKETKSDLAESRSKQPRLEDVPSYDSNNPEPDDKRADKFKGFVREYRNYGAHSPRKPGVPPPKGVPRQPSLNREAGNNMRSRLEAQQRRVPLGTESAISSARHAIEAPPLQSNGSYKSDEDETHDDLAAMTTNSEPSLLAAPSKDTGNTDLDESGVANRVESAARPVTPADRSPYAEDAPVQPQHGNSEEDVEPRTGILLGAALPHEKFVAGAVNFFSQQNLDPEILSVDQLANILRKRPKFVNGSNFSLYHSSLMGYKETVGHLKPFLLATPAKGSFGETCEMIRAAKNIETYSFLIQHVKGWLTGTNAEKKNAQKEKQTAEREGDSGKAGGVENRLYGLKLASGFAVGFTAMCKHFRDCQLEDRD